MGAEQPKKISKVTKPQIDIGALKARIHLELYRDRKNNEVIKGQKDLVAKIRAKSRNKTEEILLAQRVVNGLKVAQACNLLIGYAATLRGQAHFIAENMFDPKKMEPWLPMIYSLIYAADHLGLSSLAEFKNLMRALNDPVAVEKYVNPQILNALAPNPSAEEINIYMLEFSERNQIALEEINMIGHKFTKDWQNIPSVPSIPSDTSFDELGKRLDEEMKNKNNHNNQGNNPYQGNPYGNQNFNPNNQGFNPNNQGFNPNNQGFNPNNQGFNPNNQGFSNNQPNNQGFNPNNQGINPNNNYGNPYVNQYQPNQGGLNPYNNPNGGNTFVGNAGSNQQPANLGPNFYMPADITPNNKPVIPAPRSSINSINDIDYYPEIDSDAPLFNKGGFSDPNFDEICQRLKKGL